MDFRFGNALIVRAAEPTGCTILFSEDLQNQRQINGVKTVNPFLTN